ncbi:MAG: nickel pincer cofactor biosynthesis protein LarB [Candidatus Manganitrophus sp.]|nr:nickel pincer cofactor biosynthesis protein LarB [Candidatus Manganitrophus sp.]MDC4225945.1 nickel pincer cofactor biosynthesis protein LarB [Candidatus Manganitrophus sp.]WDT72779.1 MAG: nickel pincer cofactor biosynthesis protein LarB [Candidatus Manganitrophus sp.]
MNRDLLERLLREVQEGKRPIEEAIERLRHLPYESLGFARLDHHRTLRQEMPEVVFCPGKTEAQVLTILQKLDASEVPVLATRVEPALARKILKKLRKAEHNPLARTIVLKKKRVALRPGEIALLTGGTADLPVAEEAKVTAELLGYRVLPFYDVGVAGIHRLLDQREKIEKSDLMIVIAGMDGALSSVVGGLFGQPVIAVPTSIGYGTSFGGIAPLLTMLNSCAAGLAVVNIDNGFGAAILAHRILKDRKS